MLNKKFKSILSSSLVKMGIEILPKMMQKLASRILQKKLFSSSVIALDIERDEVRCIHVAKEKNVVRLLSHFSIPLNAFEKFPALLNNRTVTGLQLDEVVFRKLILPLKSSRKILSVLPFQLETLLPFPLDQTIVCPFLKPLDHQSTEVSLIATSKDRLKEHLAHFANLGIDPDVVTSVPIALYRLARWLLPEHKHLLLFHFERHKINCILIKDGAISLSQSIRIGTKSDGLEPELEICSPVAFNTLLTHALQRWKVFIKEKTKLADDIPWTLLGEYVDTANVNALLQEVFSGQPLSFTLPASVPEKEFHAHCLKLGFALDALSSDNHSQQFRQGEFTPPHQSKARKKSAILYATCCSLLTLILFCGTSAMLRIKTRALSDKMLTYFPRTNAHVLSKSAIEGELEKWENSLLKQKNTSPFFLTVPKVSEILAWLSTHPAFVTAEGTLKEGIDIKSFRYQLTKFPTLEDPSASYQAQVELEFTATTQRLAREFHDALLKGDRIVNGKKEIKWQPQGTLYTIQFELNKSS